MAGEAGRGLVSQGREKKLLSDFGVAGHGLARLGRAWYGEATSGRVWQGIINESKNDLHSER